MASRKQTVYKELLEFGLTWLRNAQELPIDKRPESAAWFRLGDLLHNLPTYILNEEFAEDDLYFLNAEIRGYIENSAALKDYWYGFYRKKAVELFDLVPDTLKAGLQWSGPTSDHPIQ